MRLAWWFVLSLAVVPLPAQVCAPTPEAAAIAVVAAMGAAPGNGGGSGYRVQDVQADPMMQRVWLRVSRCGEPSAPLILVPVHAMLAGTAPLAPAQLSSISSATPLDHALPPAPPQIAIHAGDAVKAVFVSDNVRMELDAVANGQAAVGSPVEITLARRGDEPAHRMHGVLRAHGRVEVQP